MKVILSHPTGNECSRAVAKGLLDAEMMGAFYTSIASFPGSLPDRLGTINLFAEINRRRFEPALQPYTHTSPWRETGRLVNNKVGIKSLLVHENGFFSIDKVYESIDKKVASALKREQRIGANSIYAYEDAAFYTFKEAKKLGIQCLYDQPIGYWRTARRLLQAEVEKWPEWAATLTGLKDSEHKLARKDEELRLADHIFCGSSFTAKTLQDFPGELKSVKVLTYGFPTVKQAKTYTSAKNRPLKLLFVGGLSQRKGIADLFTVVNNLGSRVELTIVGRKTANYCVALNQELSKHKWIPSMPHHDVLKIMREHDVLLFPSLFEGFGLVITEAMAQGTPVITTDRTAGPDIIENDRNGWIIPGGSTQQLQAVIADILMNPEKISLVGKEALETARQRPWAVYSNELAELIQSLK